MSSERPRLDRAIYFTRSGNYAKSKEILDEIIVSPSDETELRLAQFMRASGWESERFPEGKDLDAALADFRSASQTQVKISSRAMVGCARVLFKQNGRTNLDEVVRLCNRAIELDANPQAMMLLGQVHDLLLGDTVEAGRWYLRAFRQGLPWGMRYYAYLECRKKNWGRGLSAHIASAVSFPFLTVIKGRRSPFG